MSAATSLVQYIGLKAKKTDTTCGTGLTWLQGQTHEVKNEFLPALLKHVDVWRLASEPVAPKALTLEQARADGLVLEPESPALAAVPDAATAVVESQASIQPTQAEPEADKPADKPADTLVPSVDVDELEEKLNAMDDKAVRAFAAEKGLSVAANSRGSALRSKVLSLLSEG